MTASDLAPRSTDELVRDFKDTAKRAGTVFTAKTAPEKLKQTPERKGLVGRMRALSAELYARRPMADIRALLNDEDADVRSWAAAALCAATFAHNKIRSLDAVEPLRPVGATCF